MKRPSVAGRARTGASRLCRSWTCRSSRSCTRSVRQPVGAMQIMGGAIGSSCAPGATILNPRDGSSRRMSYCATHRTRPGPGANPRTGFACSRVTSCLRAVGGAMGARAAPKPLGSANRSEFGSASFAATSRSDILLKPLGRLASPCVDIALVLKTEGQGAPFFATAPFGKTCLRYGCVNLLRAAVLCLTLECARTRPLHWAGCARETG